MKLPSRSTSTVLTILALLALSASVTFADTPLGTAFTYDGRLTDGGAPANGAYDFKFKLFDALTNGTQQGGTVTTNDVAVTNGLFTVQLDFGANVFNGAERYLEILVRAGSSTGAYTTLSPRQLLTPTPYALFSTKPWVTSGNDISYTQGKVGIGTLAPTSQLHVRDTANFLQGVFDGGNQTAGIALKGGRQWELQSVDPGTAIAPGGFVVYDRTGSAYRMVVSSSGNVGIGTSSPAAKLDVVANTASAGSNTANFADAAIGPNMSHIHYGTMGDWYIRSAANGGKVILQDSGGNVGIGTNNPADKLTVAGTINSTSGGYKFPDGSVQATAVGRTYTSYGDYFSEINTLNAGFGSLVHLDLPPGNYLIEGTVSLQNQANLYAQDNRRLVYCYLAGDHLDTDVGSYDNGSPIMRLSGHAVKIYTQLPTTRVDLECKAGGGNDRTYVYAVTRRITAVEVGPITVQ